MDKHLENAIGKVFKEGLEEMRQSSMVEERFQILGRVLPDFLAWPVSEKRKLVFYFQHRCAMDLGICPYFRAHPKEQCLYGGQARTCEYDVPQNTCPNWKPAANGVYYPHLAREIGKGAERSIFSHA